MRETGAAWSWPAEAAHPPGSVPIAPAATHSELVSPRGGRIHSPLLIASAESTLNCQFQQPNNMPAKQHETSDGTNRREAVRTRGRRTAQAPTPVGGSGPGSGGQGNPPPSSAPQTPACPHSGPGLELHPGVLTAHSDVRSWEVNLTLCVSYCFSVPPAAWPWELPKSLLPLSLSLLLYPVHTHLVALVHVLTPGREEWHTYMSNTGLYTQM